MRLHEEQKRLRDELDRRRKLQDEEKMRHTYATQKAQERLKESVNGRYRDPMYQKDTELLFEPVYYSKQQQRTHFPSSNIPSFLDEASFQFTFDTTTILK